MKKKDDNSSPEAAKKKMRGSRIRGRISLTFISLTCLVATMMFVTIFRYGQEIDPGSSLDIKYVPMQNNNRLLPIPDHGKREKQWPLSVQQDEYGLNVISDLPAKQKSVFVKVQPQGDQKIAFVGGGESHSPEDQSNHDEAFVLQQQQLLKQQSQYMYENEKSLDQQRTVSGLKHDSDSSRPDLLSPILQPVLELLPAQPSLSLTASSPKSGDKSNLLTVDNNGKFNAVAAAAPPDVNSDHPVPMREAAPSLQLLFPLQSLSSSLSSPTSLSSSTSGEATKKPSLILSSSSVASLRVSDALLDSLPKLISSLNSLQDMSMNRTSSTSPSVSSTISQAVDPQRKVTFDAADLESTREFVINKPNFCDDDNGATNDLLVVVNSAVSHFEARDAIRQTWGQFAVERGSLVLFLLGSVDPSSADADVIQEKVFEEESLHGDLLQGTFVDNYYNLTLKTISLLRWVNATCDRIKYVLKIDDDMFVNMQMMVDFCETRLFPKAVIGKLARKWKPHRNKLSKWFVPQEAFNGTVYPNFATGPAYMFSGDATRPLLETSLALTPIYLEDVYVTGIVAEKAGVRRLNHALIKNVRLRVDACTFKRFMTSHRHSPQEIINLWKLVYETPGKNCTQPVVARPAAAAAPAAAPPKPRQNIPPAVPSAQSSWPQPPPPKSPTQP